MKKSLKKQAVFPVLMLLVVTALALIGSSFAWFSMSTTASVQSISGTIEDSSIGLMISKDARNFTSSVNFNENNGTTATFVNPFRFHQMSSTNGQTFYEATITQKNADGTAAKITSAASTHSAIDGNTTGTLVGWYNNGNSVVKLAAGEASKTVETVTYNNQAGYMVFDLFFEVDAAANLYLNQGTAFDMGGNGNNAMRVAFISYGSVAVAENADPATVAANAIALNTPGTTVIWNPTPNATTTTAKYYGVSGISGANEFVPYDESEYTTIVNALPSTSLWNEASAFTDTDTLGENGTLTPYTPVQVLAAGVNKLRVVVWLEGNDASCTSKIAKNTVSIALSFFAKALA